MSMFFSASDSHATTYVVSGNRDKAKAWIRKQSTPSRFVFIATAYDRIVDSDDVVVFPATLTADEKEVLRRLAEKNRWNLRTVFG